jgi:hypothetical protein
MEDKQITAIVYSQCPVCAKKEAQAAISKQLKDISHMHNQVVESRICNSCEEMQKKGIVLVLVKDAKTEEDIKNPYRLGPIAVVTEEFITKIIANEALLQYILSTRVAFIPESAWKMIGMDEIFERAATEN